MERLPYQVTGAAAMYDGIQRLPVAVLLDNVRSMYNVGAFFRTADAVAAGMLCLGGITAHPPKRAITKTALGAEERVRWEHGWEVVQMAARLRERGFELAAVETSLHSVDLFDWTPRFPVCIMFGSEVDGLGPQLAEMADVHVRIPMLGMKHSLNVATAGGVVLYELLRKYRALKKGTVCAGINRHVVGDERALQERSSESILTSSLAESAARWASKRR